MDLSYLEQYSSAAYHICFKNVLRDPCRRIGEEEKSAMKDCFSRYFESTKVVSAAFHEYIMKHPSAKNPPRSDD